MQCNYSLVSLGCLPEVSATDLVPDEDRGGDSDDLAAQIHLGTSDIPDVLGGVTMEGPMGGGTKPNHVFKQSLTSISMLEICKYY